jgi:hypothetical protein
VARSFVPLTVVHLVIPGSRPVVQDAPLFVDVEKPMAQAPPSKIRPTWYAATMVEPEEKVSGSTFARWLVAEEALQVAWVNGSVPMSFVAADAVVGPPTTPAASVQAARVLRTARRRGVLGWVRSRE